MYIFCCHTIGYLVTFNSQLPKYTTNKSSKPGDQKDMESLKLATKQSSRVPIRWEQWNVKEMSYNNRIGPVASIKHIEPEWWVKRKPDILQWTSPAHSRTILTTPEGQDFLTIQECGHCHACVEISWYGAMPSESEREKSYISTVYRIKSRTGLMFSRSIISAESLGFRL